MADLTIIEKYPNSYRIDHPDFGDVSKTTYAKGVITEVKKLSDDPIALTSQVKVMVGSKESDLIPLFYHPKPQYWDNVTLATDFNTAGKFFEKAWMSFRAGDEVAVMLKEGAPVFAIGFADGVPRIGEDIIQFECVTPFRWQMSKDQIYPSTDGPDGVPLNLKLKAELISDLTGPDTYYNQKTISYIRTASLNENVTPIAPGYYGFTYVFEGEDKHYTMDVHDTYINQTIKYSKRGQFHLMKVGPILYLIFSRWMGNWHLVNETFHSDQTPDPSWYADCQWQYFCIYPWVGCMPPDPPAYFNDCNGPDGTISADAAAYVAAQAFTETYPDFDLSTHSPASVAFRVFAAPYSDELYAAIKANPPTMNFSNYAVIPDPPPGFVEQSALTSAISWYWYYHGGTKVKSIAPDSMDYHVRPHTKAELQAAGMWPAGAS